MLLCNLNFQTGNTGVHDTVVNQLLAKIDGVEQLNNILVIGEEIFFCLLLFIYQWNTCFQHYVSSLQVGNLPNHHSLEVPVLDSILRKKLPTSHVKNHGL